MKQKMLKFEISSDIQWMADYNEVIILGIQDLVQRVSFPEVTPQVIKDRQLKGITIMGINLTFWFNHELESNKSSSSKSVSSLTMKFVLHHGS